MVGQIKYIIENIDFRYLSFLSREMWRRSFKYLILGRTLTPAPRRYNSCLASFHFISLLSNGECYIFLEHMYF